MKKTIVIAIAMCLLSFANAQKKWTGLANDGLWNNPANWLNNELPLETDMVLLDNSFFAESYTVQLPTTLVKVKYLTITPLQGYKIELILPPANTLDSALMVTGKGYSIVLNDGAVFKNQSEAPKGYGLYMGDSLRINDGAQYIHNTKRSNANIVKFLSRAPGTEHGIFEFDVPGTTGYTPSLTGRTFGTLVFSATAVRRTYSCTGSNLLTVRGDLLLNGDVTLSLGFSSDIVIKGNVVQKGGTLNLDNVTKTINTSTTKIAGNIQQSAGATITHSGVGNITLELNGTTPQLIDMKGALTSDITFKVNNNNGVTLAAPLSLPFKLSLQNSVLRTDANNLLTLQSTCGIEVADAAKSFINGPVMKCGLNNENFEFFVGNNNGHPIWAMNATGDIMVEYKNENTSDIGTAKSDDVKHLSQSGYWVVGSINNAKAQLAIIPNNETGIKTSESSFIVQYENSQWTNKGSTSSSSNGYIMSREIALNGNGNFFTLGSNEDFNTLPLHFVEVKLQQLQDHCSIKWTVTPDLIERFEIERSVDGKIFFKCGEQAYVPGMINYNLTCALPVAKEYYRIKAITPDEKSIYSKIVCFDKMQQKQVVNLSIKENYLLAQINAEVSESVVIRVFSLDGKMIKQETGSLTKGINSISIGTGQLQQGIYILNIQGKCFEQYSMKFMKY